MNFNSKSIHILIYSCFLIAVCKQSEQCPPVKVTPAKNIPHGMERTVDNSGCCNKEKLTCNKTKCIKLTCPTFMVNENVEGTENNCCPIERCGRWFFYVIS